MSLSHASSYREIKFGALLDRLPFPFSTYFATGHYARKAWSSPSSSSDPPRPKLLRPADTHKDQTYFLSATSESSFTRALFPLASLPKPSVRALAKEHNLHNAERPDSVGICFVGEKAKFREFLGNYIPNNPGDIVNLQTGEVVGRHDGLWNYTIGENARLAGMKTKMNVAKKDLETNTVYVVPGSYVFLFSLLGMV